ncbi:hypothetical protein B0O41_1654 [Propionibacteriaceae bacterium ES.041]|uniref:Ribbon-helix-helix protein, CopG family n=2 Tax=Enemella evansiae TaxID=2016499 RepID=A0A255G5V1_9ACTN|nr:hypothetical protein [Enemella evansiae]PFG66853.1 hypothetical protein B0O41_1654 [Propionibacteriaceae bacterium ES.041]OYO00393.1 hypothetical protein CGZ96_04670 [Enemella evansiae]OYO02816.1 hypothetical protein CGZ95_05715 [Enemella evansiae]OYO05638.1 hypothetical protein CGZ97_02725 [Enemella evansiae]OYO09593.1 hypothetical protein CGZ94_18200 [Enemella evansiae]
MPRKVAMPGSAEILKGNEPADGEMSGDSPDTTPRRTPKSRTPAQRGSGRVRHEDKITVYVSREELVRLEQARLTLRAEHGLAVDRGRLVREAVAAALDDLAESGPDSELLSRLTES